MKLIMKTIPWALIALRALLPLPIWLAARSGIAETIAPPCILLAALSDVYDGKIARKIGSATPFLRRTDSVVDIFFLITTAALFMIYHSPIEMPVIAAIQLMLSLSLTGHAISFIRFRRNAAVHSKLLKVYAVFVYVGFFCAWIFGSLSPWIFIALAVGLLAEAERHWILIRSQAEPIDISGMSQINQRDYFSPRINASKDWKSSGTL